MAEHKLQFKVYHGGKFNRQSGCVYVGGDMHVYHEAYEFDCLSYFEIEGIVKKYGYKYGDHIYYKEPYKSLVDGLRLLSSDHDVLQMVQHHACHHVVVLYLLAFEDFENEEALNDDSGRQHVNRNDPFWSEVLSSDDDAFDDGEDDEDRGDGLHGVEIDTEGGEDGSDGCYEVEVEAVGRDKSDVGNGSHMVVYNASDVDENSNADTSRGKEVHSFSSLSDGDDDKSYDYSSDILESPRGSDEDVSSLPKCVTRCHTFQRVDLSNPQFQNGKKFPDVYTFRQAISQYNVLKGNDILFKKNDKDRVYGVQR
jgi:hypothetical protein